MNGVPVGRTYENTTIYRGPDGRVLDTQKQYSTSQGNYFAGEESATYPRPIATSTPRFNWNNDAGGSETQRQSENFAQGRSASSGEERSRWHQSSQDQYYDRHGQAAGSSYQNKYDRNYHTGGHDLHEYGEDDKRYSEEQNAAAAAAAGGYQYQHRQGAVSSSGSQYQQSGREAASSSGIQYQQGGYEAASSGGSRYQQSGYEAASSGGIRYQQSGYEAGASGGSQYQQGVFEDAAAGKQFRTHVVDLGKLGTGRCSSGNC